MKTRTLVLGVCVALLLSCGARSSRLNARRDVHSFSRPDQVQVKFVDLDLEVLFDRKVLKGTATLQFDRWVSAAPLILDARNLRIEKVELAGEDGPWAPGTYTLGAADPILGAPLTIPLTGSAARARVHYSTQPGATALQWLEPAQTAGKQQPFLYTQSQAIHARSWIPLQDTPAVRTRYRATIHTPKNLLAAMSAHNDASGQRNGNYNFFMPAPIPSYLIALAVGDLEFRSLGARTGVYAEKAVIDRAAREFEDTEKMLRAAEGLFGRYRWPRYDLLVLPPSFPYGGMENPCLTFATPTIIAGDKSLVSLVAHELAHSWAGNQVTNATWSDFWLNEGLAVYAELRVVEQVYGPARAGMQAVLGRRKLAQELARLPAPEQILHIDLAGRDPDDGSTDIPYEKGSLFFRQLEEAFGRPAFDDFLKRYFEHFRFTSITTSIFHDFLRKQLLSKKASANVPVDEWLYRPGLPASAPQPRSEAFAKIDAGAPPGPSWSPQEWLYFLNKLPPRMSPAEMRALDQAHHLTQTGNAEILCQWLTLAIRHNYEAAWPRLEEFLATVGRRYYVKQLFEELVKTPEGKARAAAIYRKARPLYHPITAAAVDALLK